MTTTYLSDFLPIYPRYSIPQRELLTTTAETHERAAELTGQDIPAKKMVLRFGVKDSQVASRRVEMDDFYTPPEEREIYRITPETPRGAPIQTRMDFFNRRAEEIFAGLYDAEGPEHLIHVSCTGYAAPSAPQILAAERGWRTEITHAYHMGCYASLPSIRLAAAQCIAYGKIVDIVHTEMCTLHMDPAANSPEQIVVQSLFADGHIRYRLSRKHPDKPGFRLIGLLERLLPNTKNSMSWVPAAWGMKMELSREVPDHIKAHIRGFFLELLEQHGLPLRETLARSIFAVHPGGPKIIDVIQAALELSDDQVAASRQVLLERGNMSSATLPHVWHEILGSGAKAGTPVISFAFGPGLTVFGGAFEVAA